jgi:hypothetical protein
MNAPQILKLMDWLEEMKAELKWEVKTPVGALAYYVMNGRHFFIHSVGEKGEHGWDAYTPIVDTRIDRTLDALRDYAPPPEGTSQARHLTNAGS